MAASVVALSKVCSRLDHEAWHSLHLQGVASGSLTVGDAVLFVTLIQQLYQPLNYFGKLLRSSEADASVWLHGTA